MGDRTYRFHRAQVRGGTDPRAYPALPYPALPAPPVLVCARDLLQTTFTDY